MSLVSEVSLSGLVVTMRWEKVKTKGDVPSGRASHCAVTLRNCIYIFGGMMAEGATNSMYKFHTGEHFTEFVDLIEF